MIHPMTQGEQALQGHQFPIETPEKIVDFIISHSSPDKQKEWFELRGGLENARMVFTRTGKGRVAFLGGSITANPGWRNMVCDELQRRFPDTEFEFIAAGIPSTGSPMGAYRLHRDVLSKGPIDLLFEEAAVNDSSIGHSDQDQQNAMEGIVRHARESNPEMDIILMHFVDPTKMKEYNAGKVPAVITNHESVAIHYNIPSINLALEVTDRINLGEFTWKDDFKNLHPSPFGQKLYFNTINRLFNAAWPGEPAEDDKVTVHPLPEKLYSGCYNNGQFLSPTVVTDLKGFKQDPNWKNEDEANTRPGFVDVPMLVGENPGDEFSLTFNGNAIGLMIAAGPDAGTIEFKIDNGEWTEINLFTKWSRGLHLPRLHMLTSDLEDKAHLLTVRISDKKHKVSTGHACRIAYIAINGTLADEQ